LYLLSNYIDKEIRVKFSGGLEVIGILKGFDGLNNLVLDESKEIRLKDSEEDSEGEKTRELGLIVVRGSHIVVISPTEGTEEINNPFLQAEEQ